MDIYIVELSVDLTNLGYDEWETRTLGVFSTEENARNFVRKEMKEYESKEEPKAECWYTIYKSIPDVEFSEHQRIIYQSEEESLNKLSSFCANNTVSLMDKYPIYIFRR